MNNNGKKTGNFKKKKKKLEGFQISRKIKLQF